MEKNIVKEEIIEILEVILEQSEIISKYSKQIPQIEIDIVLSNIRELYEKYKTLDALNNLQNNLSSHVFEEKVKPETVKKLVIIEEMAIIKKEEVAEPVKEDKVKVPEVVSVTTSQIVIPIEEKTEEKKTVIEDKSLTEAEQSQKKSKTKRSSIDLFSAHSTIADKFKDDKRSLNEKLSGSHDDKSIASKLHKNPISDLKAAIGINEKFKFINELFEGNLQKYNDSLAKLNGFNDLQEAEKYLAFLKDEFSWKDGSEAFHELADLISRRYIL
jgi:hypothetical protein